MAFPHDGKKFKKGDPNINRNGAPKKLPKLDELLAEVVGEEGMKDIVEAMRNKAKKGDTRAAEIILDRGYGKPKQDIDVTSGGEAIKGFVLNIKPEEETK